MRLWEDPSIVELLRNIVARGCARYRRVFAAAGWECDGCPGWTRTDRDQATREVYHEFLLHLIRKGVTPEGVVYPKAFFWRAFLSFAEDVRERVGRPVIVYGDLEAGRDLEGEDRDGTAALVDRAVSKWERAAWDDRREDAGAGVRDCLRRLGGLAHRDQLHCFLENYPLVRESEFFARRLRILYGEAYGAEFPEEEADRLWEMARAQEYGRIRERLDLVKGSLSHWRQKRAELLSLGEEKAATAVAGRIAELLIREAEITDRCAYLLRLKPSHVLRILPAPNRPTLNALTVALHRSRERLEAAKQGVRSCFLHHPSSSSPRSASILWMIRQTVA